MKKGQEILQSNLEAYKKKLFLNELIKSSIVYIGLTLLIFLVITTLEYFFFLDGKIRATLLIFTVLWLVVTIIKGLTFPYLKFIRSNSQISNLKAAKNIGEYLPEIEDKLLNTIMLRDIQNENALAAASIGQRTHVLSNFSFTKIIDLKQNYKYLKYSSILLLAIILIASIAPHFFSESSNRIINYDQDFSKNAFNVILKKEKLTAFKNEDYDLKFSLNGEYLPNSINIVYNNSTHKVNFNSNTETSFTFKKVQKDFSFYFESADYKSKNYDIDVVNRPEIKKIRIDIDFPSYTQINDAIITNNGNITIPEGSIVKWNIETLNSEKIKLFFKKDSTESIAKRKNQTFSASKKILHSTSYQIDLQNENGTNKEVIIYNINSIEDKYPNIEVTQYQDSTLYSFISFSGTVGDDYGISNLYLEYERNQQKQVINIPFDRKQKNQNFAFNWQVKDLNLLEGESLSYYFVIYDNDGINGPKASKTSNFSFSLPRKEQLDSSVSRSSQEAKKELNKSLEKVKDLNKNLSELSKDLKKQNTSNWQQKKKIEDLINEKKELEKALQELSNKNKEILEKQNQFNKPNKDLQEKANQLQKLMDDLLDDETKALYEELQKLLENEKDLNKNADEMIDAIEHSEKNLEKNIERALEMFKKMQFDYELDQVINDLESLENKQKQLQEETEEKAKEQSELIENQKEIQEEFEQVKEKMDKLDQLNNELKSPEKMEDTEQQEKSIDQELNQSQESLEKKQNKKAQQSQKNAQGQMKEMKEKMKQMQSSMEMEAMSENIDNLKDILDNLLILSFSQEDIMKTLKEVNQTDPRYITLSQKQLKLKDDAVIIEDSLIALANRVFQIQSFVTREVHDMNSYIQKSLQGLKDRKKSIASTNQQYSMTSINNLALLLSDVLNQMQQQMAEAMGMPQKGEKGQKQDIPSLTQMQQQIKNKIEQLKQGKQSGRSLSKELAELAAEQEMLRQKLENIEGEMEGEGPSKNLKEAIKKMEQTEKDLVNKNITQQTIQRQNEIITRMLEAEKAQKERELDKEREAEQATHKNKKLPKEFEEYIKQKEKELELLNTVPPNMNRYYKEEVDKYFQRLIKQ